MSDEDLNRLGELHAKTTQEKWRHDEVNWGGGSPIEIIVGQERDDAYEHIDWAYDWEDIFSVENRYANADFCCEAHETVPQLIAEVKRLREWIIDADSAFNLDGKRSTLEECIGLEAMCHAGRAAMDEVERLRSVLAEVRRLNGQASGLENASTEAWANVWEIENLIAKELT